MGDKISINDQLDWAIIQSFCRAEKHILMLKAIISIVREFSDKKDKTIEARIRKLVEIGYLVKYDNKSEVKNSFHNKERSESKRRPGLYGLNEDFEFEYTGIPLTSKPDLIKVPDDVRRKHTADLKEAIENWIKYFPEPTYNYPLIKEDQLEPSTNHYITELLKLDPYNSNIDMCEQHILFSDLCNHLLAMDCDVCVMWAKYKEKLSDLNATKTALLNSLVTAIDNWANHNVPFYAHYNISGHRETAHGN